MTQMRFCGGATKGSSVHLYRTCSTVYRGAKSSRPLGDTEAPSLGGRWALQGHLVQQAAGFYRELVQQTIGPYRST